MADILDNDPEVIRWLRNSATKSGISIKYKFGNYYPDLVAETQDITYVLEVKSSDALHDVDVLEKAREGISWCNKMTKVTGKTWKYGIVPHDRFARNDSFRMVISQIIAIN